MASGRQAILFLPFLARWENGSEPDFADWLLSVFSCILKTLLIDPGHYLVLMQRVLLILWRNACWYWCMCAVKFPRPAYKMQTRSIYTPIRWEQSGTHHKCMWLCPTKLGCWYKNATTRVVDPHTYITHNFPVPGHKYPPGHCRILCSWFLNHANADVCILSSCPLTLLRQTPRP